MTLNIHPSLRPGNRRPWRCRGFAKGTAKGDEEILKRAAAIKKKQELEKVRARRAKTLKMVGKCFKYRNSFGGDDKGWWLYGKIVGVTSDGYPKSQRFQTNTHGHFEMTVENYDIMIADSSWKPISAKTYDNQLKSAVFRALKLFGYDTQKCGNQVYLTKFGKK